MTFDNNKKLVTKTSKYLMEDPETDTKCWSRLFLVRVHFLVSHLDQRRRQQEPKRFKVGKSIVGREPFCFDPVPSDVSGLFGGWWVGERLITDIQEVMGLLFPTWCVQPSNGDDIYDGGSGPTHSPPAGQQQSHPSGGG